MEFSDKQLVSKVKSGESSSYEQLFEKYQSKIYNFAYDVVGNKEDAKDVAQEAFVKVFEALPRLEEKLNFSAYLYKTARNLAIDELKKKQRMGTPEALDIERDLNIQVRPQRALLLQEQQNQVRGAAMSLSGNFRTVLILRELHNLSYGEIASIMEVPKNTVGVLLLRARLKFKQEFRMTQVDVEKLSKKCKEMLPLLSGYIDNELTDKQRGKVKDHIKDCSFCRLALEDMTEASKSYRVLIPLIPPAILKEGVLSRISKLLQAPKATSSEPSLAQSEAIPPHSPTASPTPPKTFLARIAGMSAAKKALLVLFFSTIFAGGVLGGLYGLVPPSKKEDLSRSPQIKKKAPAKTTEKKQTNENETKIAPAGSGSGKQELENKTPEEPATPEPPEEKDTTPPKTPSLLSPPDNSLLTEPDVTLQWSEVTDPSGVTYSIEIQYFAGGGEGYYPLELKQGLASPEYPHTVGDLKERWRVWAVDDAGNASAKTGWWRMTRAAGDDK